MVKVNLANLILLLYEVISSKNVFLKLLLLLKDIDYAGSFRFSTSKSFMNLSFAGLTSQCIALAPASGLVHTLLHMSGRLP